MLWQGFVAFELALSVVYAYKAPIDVLVLATALVGTDSVIWIIVDDASSKSVLREASFENIHMSRHFVNIVVRRHSHPEI